MRRAILDTGPLVAWLCPRDQYHQWALRAFKEVSPGSLVCEAVLAEACHLVANEGIPRAKVIQFARQLRLQPISLCAHLEAIELMLERYADAPMDFADGCVIRLAELNVELSVCTVDSQFRFFRKNARDPLSLIAPFAS
jgi:predicted nucleic acid-binding protein